MVKCECCGEWVPVCVKRAKGCDWCDPTCSNCVYAEEGVCSNGGGEISSVGSCDKWEKR